MRGIREALPLLSQGYLVAVLFGFVFAFTDMIVVYVLTRGGPFDTTQVLASLAFFKGIDGGDLAGGAATALFAGIIAVAASSFGIVELSMSLASPKSSNLR